jgi:hypothetical protein
LQPVLAAVVSKMVLAATMMFLVVSVDNYFCLLRISMFLSRTQAKVLLLVLKLVDKLFWVSSRVLVVLVQ